MNIRKNREIAAKGRALRKEAEGLRDEGYSNADIADKLGTNADLVERMIGPENIDDSMIIWFPGIYSGRQGWYAKTVGELPEQRVIVLVQKRVREDGEWCIANDRVGNNEAGMRQMMAWAGDSQNIEQALEHIRKEENAHIRTVDYLCRDLANAAKWIAGGNAREE